MDFAPLQVRFDSVEKLHDRAERLLKEEMSANRNEAFKQGGALRQEIQSTLKSLGESMVNSVSEISKIQEGRLNGFSSQLSTANESFQESARQLREEVANRVTELNGSTVESFSKLAELQKGQLESFSNELRKLTESNERKFESLQQAVETKLGQIQQDNDVLDDGIETVPV